MSEKTAENYEWLGRQARSEIEPGTSHLPVLSAQSLPLVGPPLLLNEFVNLSFVNSSLLEISFDIEYSSLTFVVKDRHSYQVSRIWQEIPHNLNCAENNFLERTLKNKLYISFRK